MRILAGLVLAATVTVGGAQAQRSAVAADLSPEKAGAAFSQAVLDVCVPAAAGNGVSSRAAAREGRVQPTQDADTRRQVGAQASETVWDVVAARGVVVAREGQGRCTVSVYGPAVGPTILSATQALSRGGFEALVGAGSASQTLLGTRDGKRISVQVSGMEPGAPGHQSRFSVVTATVTVVQ